MSTMPLSLVSTPRLSAWARRHGWQALVWGMMAVAFALVAWPNVHNYLSAQSMMADLGNMSQAIWSVLHGKPLEYTTTPQGNVSRLSGHAEVFYVFLAPLLLLWPSPVVLILAQALLVVSGAWAFFRVGRRILGSEGWGALAAFLYLMYPVGQTAAMVEIHGDAFALPWVAWALAALEERRWRRYALFVALALLCKVYVSAVLLLLAGVLWWRGERKVALATALASLAWAALVVFGFWHWFSPVWKGVHYAALRYARAAGTPQAQAALWLVRLFSATVIFTPLLWPLRWIWPWALPGVALALLGLSTNTVSNVSYRNHHYALSVPFFVWALLWGWRRLQAQGDRRRLRLQVGATTLTVTLLSLFTVIAPLVWPHVTALVGEDWGMARRHWVRSRLQEVIPPAAPVLATPTWAAQLCLRPQVYITHGTQYRLGEPLDLTPVLERVRFAVVDGFFPYARREFPGVERETLALLLNDPRFGLVTQWDGVALFRRGAAPDASAEACATPAGQPPQPLNEALTLKGYAVQVAAQDATSVTLEGCYRWARQGPVPAGYAVSRLVGVAFSRGLHLDTWALSPPSAWRQGEHTERVRWSVPRREGCFTLAVGWHSVSTVGVAQGLIGREVTLGTLCIQGDSVTWRAGE